MYIYIYISNRYSLYISKDIPDITYTYICITAYMHLYIYRYYMYIYTYTPVNTAYLSYCYYVNGDNRCVTICAHCRQLTYCVYNMYIKVDEVRQLLMLQSFISEANFWCFLVNTYIVQSSFVNNAEVRTCFINKWKSTNLLQSFNNNSEAS